MKITITEAKRLATYRSDIVLPFAALLPLLDTFTANQTLTAVGDAEPLNAATKYVEISTDTAVVVNVYGTGSALLLHAGTARIFQVVPGQVLTFTAA